MNITRQKIEKNRSILIKSKDSNLINEFLESLIKKIPDYEIEITSIDNIAKIYKQNSLFSNGKKILVLYDVTSEDLNCLEEIYSDPLNLDYVLVLIERGIIAHNKIYTKIKSSSLFLELKSLSDRQCVNWVSRCMRENSLDFETRVPEYIVNNLGSDLGVLKNEIKKIKLLNSGERITVNMCERIISEGHNFKYFDFVDNFFRKRIADIFKSLSKISEYEYIKLLHFMMSQSEKLYKVAIYREQRRSLEEISDLMGIPKFIIRTKFFINLGYFNKIKLIKVLDIFNDLDLQLRSTKYHKKICFESYILKALNA